MTIINLVNANANVPYKNYIGTVIVKTISIYDS